MKGKLTRITIAITLLGAIVALAYFNASDLYINGQQEWFGYAYNKALQLYQNGESIEHITEHSLDGFPYLRFLIVVSLIAAITFIVLKICFGVKTGNVYTLGAFDYNLDTKGYFTGFASTIYASTFIPGNNSPISVIVTVTG